MVTTVWCGQAVKNYISYTENVISNQSYASVGRVTGNLSKIDLKLNTQAGKPMFYYDYYPSSMPVKYRETWLMSDQGRKTILNQQIKGSDSAVRVSKHSINNGIQIKPLQKIRSNTSLILPVLGYKGLKYQTFINGHQVTNHIQGMNLAINAHSLSQSNNITIMFKNPPIYAWIVIISLVYDLLLVAYLKPVGNRASIKTRKTN